MSYGAFALVTLSGLALWSQQGVQPGDAPTLPLARTGSVTVLLHNKGGKLVVLPHPFVQEWIGADGRKYKLTVAPRKTTTAPK